jgi:hypothetical protein
VTPEEIIEDRKSIHGNYSNVAAKAQEIKQAIFRGGGGCVGLSAIQRESLDLIATKIARICCGDPNHRDHWDDIAGYAVLVSQRIAQPPAQPPAKGTS